MFGMHMWGEIKPQRSPPFADGDDVLQQWRERLLDGVVATLIVALVPPALIQAWQLAHGLTSVKVGLLRTVLALLALTVIGLWRGPYPLRAWALIGLGSVSIGVGVITEGLAPSQFAIVCALTTAGVVLSSARTAGAILAGAGVCMAVAAYLFSHGYVVPPPRDYVDPRQPMNWVRVGLFTLFSSAATAVATSYLLSKLRSTLEARSALVERLGEEIAQRERALSDLQRAQTRLVQAQKLEAIGQLAAGIAHDFNNTLSVVALEAELLKRDGSASTAVARGTEALLGAAERGRVLTRQLLLFGRPETGPRPIVDASRTFEECGRALRRLLPSELTFELDVAAGPLPVYIHDSELQQIVLNLGINARDAMPGGGTLRVSLERRVLDGRAALPLGLAAGTFALLTCRDTGCGMDAATVARMFEPFFTTKGPGRGTGLGLTNVWSIAQRAGGTVQVESVLGAGTTLRVYLPVTAAEPTAIMDVPAPAEERHGSETVLVVEDDIRLRALVVTMLADAGYRVLDAASVDAALALERDQPGQIDLVCTDVVMPGRPVRDLISEIRARRPSASVLVCSGYSEDEQIARGVNSGEFRYLGKPFNRSALLAAVRGALDRDS